MKHHIAPRGISLLFCISIATNLYPQDGLLVSLLDTTTEHKINQSTLYLKANYYQHSGQYHQALKTYNDLFTLDAPSYVYDGFLRLLSQTNQFLAIANLIDKTEELFKDDLEIQLIYAQSLLNTNRDQQARDLLEKLKKRYPNNEQIVYYSAAHHEKTNNLSKAIADIDLFLSKNPPQSKLFLFHFLKAKIYLKMQNLDAALASADKSLELFPEFDKGILFKALLLEQQNKIDEAIECYQSFLKISGHDPAIIKQLVQLLFSQQRFSQAAQELKKLKEETPEHYFDLALLEWKSKNQSDALTNEALANIEKALTKKPLFEKARLLKIEILLARSNHKRVLHTIKDWLMLTPTNNAVIKIIFKLCKQAISPYQTLIMLEAVHKKHRKVLPIILAIADLYLQTKQYEKALDWYKKGIVRTKDARLQAKINFQKGFIYFAMDNTKKAKRTLQKATKEKNVYPPTYNLLAYLHAQSGKNLIRAISLIDKALELEPESPYFLDTKAVILDKQGKHSDAVQMFNKARTYAPDDPIIQQHLHEAEKNLLQNAAPNVCPIP